MTKIIALTGSIATGKSFVASMIQNDLNYPIIDADKLAREVVEVNKPAYLEIVKEFGEKIINKDRTINRKELRNIIFNDKNKRNLLNKITHKYIRIEFLQKVKEYTSATLSNHTSATLSNHTLTTLSNREMIIFYDIPLLFEAKLEKEFYKIILVYTPRELQIKRLMNRDKINFNEAVKTINSQIDIEIKKKMSDFIIDNSKSKENTYNQIKTIINQLLEGE